MLKRFTAFLISMAMIVGIMPALVFAKEIDFEAEETAVEETTSATGKETSETKEKKKAEPEDSKNTKTESNPEDKKETKEEEKKPEVKEEPTQEPKEEKESEPKEAEPETGGETESKPVESSAPETKDEKEQESKIVEGPQITDKREPEAGAEKDPETEKEPETGEESKEEPKEETKEPDVIKGKLPPESYKESGPSDNDALFGKYLEDKFYKKPARRGTKSIPSRGSELTGNNAVIYNALVPMIKAVAEGTRTSTEFYFTLDDPDLANRYYTAKDLGVAAIVKDGQVTEAAYKALKAKLAIDLKAIHLSLLADHPYELYWYDKTAGINLYLPSYSAEDFHDGKGWQIHFENDNINIDFNVAEAYADADVLADPDLPLLKTDPTKINKANTAIANVDTVIGAASTKSDYDKLVYYREWIKGAVYYDHSAIFSNAAYGDPWQLVSVFDNDPTTNVVCEGYSKAFKYLCDKTNFNSDISCITVTGDMDGEDHMWNHVRMGDGNYYLVDVTNCDTGSIGYPDKLFMVGYTTCSTGIWYRYKTDYNLVKYTYDDETKKIYTNELKICNRNYNYKDLCGENLWWRVDGTNLIFTGSGNMNTWASANDVPWKSYQGKIKTITLPDTITSISDYAFTGFTGITTITIPKSVTSIGKEAFKGCTNLSVVYMDESLALSVDATAFDDCPNLDLRYYSTVGDLEYYITNPNTDGTGTVMVFGTANKSETVCIPLLVNINGVDYKVNRIYGKAFYKNTTVKTVFIGGNVTTIDSNAFYGCSKLYKVNGGARVQKIGTSAFRACAKLRIFSVSSYALKKIGVTAFSGDKALKTLQIKKTSRLTKSGVKKSLKGSSIKTVKVKKAKIKKYKKYFKKSNSGRSVKVRK